MENLIRLQNSLIGKAKDIVKSLLVLPENVEIVIENLRQHFGRSEYIVQILLEKVKNVPNIRDDKIESLFKQFSDLVTNLVFTLLKICLFSGMVIK